MKTNMKIDIQKYQSQILNYKQLKFILYNQSNRNRNKNKNNSISVTLIPFHFI